MLTIKPLHIKFKNMEIYINNKAYKVDGYLDKKLLWFIRENTNLTGTKYGCGKGLCGFCTVLVGANAVRSCQLKVSDVLFQNITTIEGVDRNHPVLKAWKEFDVPQCGYCQSGQIMQAIELLNKNPNPSEDFIKSFMYGNICRCGTYPRIIKAIKYAADLMRKS
jgi:aerobic-type carbon monoxide dehydrogenase small subunit (CoxS/CutS family)